MLDLHKKVSEGRELRSWYILIDVVLWGGGLLTNKIALLGVRNFNKERREGTLQLTSRYALLVLTAK